jgi:site-specific DNA-methyltransferase (adenine-specific)
METKVHQGDCIDILSPWTGTTVDLVYLDPPFFTQRKQALSSRDRSKEFTFDDRWRSASHYSSFLCDRLVQLHRVLKPTGSIFFHCDKTASHLARLVLDEVFGERNFQSEIIWSYKRWSNSARKLLPAHQTILFYAKGRDFKFNKLLTDYSPTTNVDQILQRRSRDAINKSVYKRDQNGDVVFSGSKQGVPLSDVWEIPFLNPKAKERTGYPTQKPILLLEQIIRLCTDEGDTVLDPFCGSGTTLVAASLMNRSAIGIDISEEAVELTRRRLAHPVKTESNLMKNGIDSYRNANKNALSLINGIPHTPVQRNNGIDAFLSETYRDVPIPVRVQRHGETVADAACALHKAARTKNAGRMILIATEDQPSLFPLEIPEEVVVIPSAALGISRSINLLKDKKETSNNAMHADGNSAALHSRR